MLKKIFVFIILTLIVVGFFYSDTISSYVIKNFIYKQNIVTYEKNKYYKSLDISFVKETENFKPNNKQDLINILYTMLNGGWSEFTFYCPDKYDKCIDDVSGLISDKSYLSNLNNFVSPYNSYHQISVSYNNLGKVTLKTDPIYSKEMINETETKIDEIINLIIKDNMTDREKIKIFHDYIINTTVYDTKNSDLLKNNNTIDLTDNSHNAYGLLFKHVSLCGGYSDVTAIFLDKIGIPNMKISNDSHVWNLVKLDNKWYHLDLTWDDPVTNTKEQVLLHNYLLVDVISLHEKDKTHHMFDTNIYTEAS